jgi:hypothetical protein
MTDHERPQLTVEEIQRAVELARVEGGAVRVREVADRIIAETGILPSRLEEVLEAVCLAAIERDLPLEFTRRDLRT